LKVERHHSAGGLVVRGAEILLISTREGKRWQLPKGHLESGETPEQAAVRETREETGVRRVMFAPPVEYWFNEWRAHPQAGRLLSPGVRGRRRRRPTARRFRRRLVPVDQGVALTR
jgi:8-oxo-dGTP pyrophosphatase MutT (NUDIX family)